MRAIDVELVKKERRLQALSLLSSFVRLQPAHLHLVLQTSIISHLHSCLLIDLSGATVDLALICLIMLLPHVASSLYSSMPKLFLIYARILCWDQYSTSSAATPIDGDTTPTEKTLDDETAGSRALEVDADWQPLDRLFNTVEGIMPKANYLFTFCYGLFPLNFMNFIRKPRRFLKMKSYPHADDLNLYQDLIRKRTENHRALHRLHPSFFTTTPEDELTDNRLLKMDATDIVTECLALCITTPNTLTAPGPPPSAKLPELPKEARLKPKLSIRSDALLADVDDPMHSATSPTTGVRSHTSWRNTQSSTATSFTAPISGQPDVSFPLPPSFDASREDSPRPLEGTSPPKGGSWSRPASRHQELKPSHSQRKAYSPPREFQPLPQLQAFAQSLSGSPRSSHGNESNDTYTITVLQRDIMLLKNDLNFERFQKAQYLAQIGQLQRKHLSEATTESQTQSLLNKNRTLTDKVKKADDLYAQLKREMTMSRSQAKKTEEQLSQKLKLYRDEEKNRQLEVQRLRVELDMTKKECEILRQMVVERETQASDARNELNTLNVDLDAMNNLKQRLSELESRLREYELSELDAERAREDHDLLQTELETAQLTIQSRDAELDRMRKTFEQKVVALENRIRKEKTMPPSDAPLPDSVQQMIDSALAASNAKYSQIKKNYKRLNEKYVELEVKFQELESGGLSPHSLRPGSVLSLTKYAEDSKPPALAGTGVSRIHTSRRAHAFSDPSTLMEEDFSEEEDMHTLQSHRHIGRANTYASKQRFESLMGTRPLQQNRGFSPPPLERRSRENSVTHDFQAGSGLSSNRQSVQALDLSTTKKVKPTSEVRVHGRGGAQNIGRAASGKDVKKDNKSDKSDRSGKTGGFRGLRGIM